MMNTRTLSKLIYGHIHFIVISIATSFFISSIGVVEMMYSVPERISIRSVI